MSNAFFNGDKRKQLLASVILVSLGILLLLIYSPFQTTITNRILPSRVQSGSEHFVDGSLLEKLDWELKTGQNTVRKDYFLLHKIAFKPYPHKCLVWFCGAKRIDREEFLKKKCSWRQVTPCVRMSAVHSNRRQRIVFLVLRETFDERS